MEEKEQKRGPVPKSKIDLNSLDSLRQAFPALDPKFLVWAMREVPQSYRLLLFKARSGRVSPRSVIKAMCQQCVGYEEARSRIKNCSVWKCPNLDLRPYQSETESEEE